MVLSSDAKKRGFVLFCFVLFCFLATSNLEQKFVSLNTLLYTPQTAAPNNCWFRAGSAISTFVIYIQCKLWSSICCLVSEWLQWYAPQVIAGVPSWVPNIAFVTIKHVSLASSYDLILPRSCLSRRGNTMKTSIEITGLLILSLAIFKVKA